MTLTLETANNFFCITLQLMMLHHHTYIGNKMFCQSEDISSGQTFTDILNLCCDLDLECSNPVFSQDTLSGDPVLSNQVWLQTDQQFRRYSRKSYFDYISPPCDLDLEDSEPIFSA